MADRLPVLYWDTCMFLEHLKLEPVEASRRRASLRVLQENAERKNRILTSTLTHAEAIPRKITAADATAEGKYWAYFDGVYFIDHEITVSVAGAPR